MEAILFCQMCMSVPQNAENKIVTDMRYVTDMWYVTDMRYVTDMWCVTDMRYVTDMRKDTLSSEIEILLKYRIGHKQKIRDTSLLKKKK